MSLILTNLIILIFCKKIINLDILKTYITYATTAREISWNEEKYNITWRLFSITYYRKVIWRTLEEPLIIINWRTLYGRNLYGFLKNLQVKTQRTFEGGLKNPGRTIKDHKLKNLLWISKEPLLCKNIDQEPVIILILLKNLNYKCA